MVSEDAPFYGSIAQRDPFSDPEYYTYYVSALERLRQLYRQMNAEEVELVKCWINKDTYAEGAKKLDMSIKTYESRLTKVRNKVRDTVNPGANRRKKL